MKITRIQCSKYSDLDEMVIHEASSLGFPLIGGTALEIWANETNHPGVRRRSDNDLDFIASSHMPVRKYRQWLSSNVDPDKVQVDIMLTNSVDFTPYVRKVNGVLVMSLPYILWSKLTRGSSKDIEDIKWILSNPKVSDEEINQVLNDFGVTPKEEELLMSLVE